MKVRIKAYIKGGSNRPPKGSLKAYYDKLVEAGYDGPQDIGSMQAWMNQNHPQEVVNYMKENPPTRLTNKGRKLYGNKKFENLTDQELMNSFHDNLWDYRNPAPSNSTANENYPGYDESNYITSEEAGYTASPGNNYGINLDRKKKNPYKQKGLPFAQAIPELYGFTSALNTYNYQTPDYQHWEISPNKLNIQPQIQSIDSSLRAVTDSTTGSPQIDSARRVGAFTQAMNAKQQVFANKQNYDAEREFQANQFNINARTQEQNLDVNSSQRIYNEFMPLAKDYATGERIKAIGSLTSKYAKNKANENKKSLFLDNFYDNIEVDENGNLKVKGSNKVNENYYPVTNGDVQKAKNSASGNKSNPQIPTATDTETPLIKPKEVLTTAQEAVLPQNSNWLNPRARKATNFYGDILNESPVILDENFLYGGMIKRRKY